MDFNIYRDSKVSCLGGIFNSLPCDIEVCKLILYGYLFNVLEKAVALASLV